MSKVTEIKTKGTIKGTHEFQRIRNGKVVDTQTYENIVCNAGLEVLLKKAVGEYAETCRIDKAVLGTGTTEPTVEDTTLETEVYKNNVISGTVKDNVLYVDAYLNPTEVVGHFKEFGYLIDDEYLFNRVIIDIEKEELDAYLIRSTFTFTNDV